MTNLRNRGYVLTESSRDVANIIIQQMGGTGRLNAMIGAKNFVFHHDLEGGVSFKFMKSSLKGAPNYIKITLNGKDLYNLEFGYIRGSKYKVVKKIDDVFAEDLRPIFKRQTGLDLHL